jgi:bacillopeptidase F
MKPPAGAVNSGRTRAAASGWTEVIEYGQSQWEIGVPASGPGSAHGGVNVLATKLAGNYDIDHAVGYRSPVIDLTGVEAATLEFYHYFDFEFEADTAYDWGELHLLNASGQNLLPAEALLFENTSGGWRRLTLVLPPEALGQRIRLEFKLRTDVLNTRPRWYIDDLLID